MDRTAAQFSPDAAPLGDSAGGGAESPRPVTSPSKRQSAPGRAAPKRSSGGTSGYPESVERLIGELGRLPGIGRRSAERLAFHLLKTPAPEALALARAVEDMKAKIRHCRVCFNLTDAAGSGGVGGDLCGICASDARDRGLVLVVEQPKDLLALEGTGMFKGLYHVLMGHLSPMEGVGPADLTVGDLMARIDDPARNAGGIPVREVILGLNPTLEGDGTALYLADGLARRAVSVTRLARGVPTGMQLEYVSKAVLADALEGRRPMT